MGQKKRVFLSVIVPVYKQEKTIVLDLTRILQVLKSTRYTFELIPVVDGTTLDNSLVAIQQANLPNTNPVGYPVNSGKGAAVRFGMQQAKGEVVTFIDAGMDIDPQGIVMLLEHMRWYEADVIIGSKLHAASIVEYPWQRKVMTYGYYLLVKMLFGLKVRDTQTGLKAYRHEVLAKVLPKLVVKQFAFDIEILAVARRFGFRRIFDAPVKVNLDWEESTIKLMGGNGVLPILQDTLAVWYRLNILRYYENKSSNRPTEYDQVLSHWLKRGGYPLHQTEL